MFEWPDGRKKLYRSTPGDYQERYETWGEAEAGHKRACIWAQEQLDKLDIKFVINDADISRRD
jgi:hypothetical protein